MIKLCNKDVTLIQKLLKTALEDLRKTYRPGLGLACIKIEDRIDFDSFEYHVEEILDKLKL